MNDLVGRMTVEEKVSQMGSVAPAIERLGIPQYNWWNEGLHGVARAGLATVFPQGIGLASTWNTNLIYRMAQVISDESRAKHQPDKPDRDEKRDFSRRELPAARKRGRNITDGLGVETFRENDHAAKTRDALLERAERPAINDVGHISDNGVHRSFLADRSHLYFTKLGHKSWASAFS